MRKAELSLKEKQKYKIIKKIVETNGSKELTGIELNLEALDMLIDLFLTINNMPLILTSYPTTESSCHTALPTDPHIPCGD